MNCLFFWKPRCKSCRKRIVPDWVDGLCFDCWYAAMNARAWQAATDAIVRMIRSV